jgi:potassium/hydrogen antiporter
MDFANHAVLIGALLVLVSILASPLARRTGAPVLLLFLAIGMLAGVDGIGGIEFDDFEAAYLIGTVGLAVILFDGGIRTRTDSFRIGLRPALSLATVGVILTAALVGAAAAWAFDLHWLEGMLVGAIVGSTDAAAVFALLHAHGMRLKQRVGTTLEIESGCNDPMAIFLTLVFVSAVATQGESLNAGVALQFVHQFGLGAALGILGGRGLAWLINRIELTSGLYPLLALAGGLSVYAITTVFGGSGFLAIYLAGLVMGNSQLRTSNNILRVHDGLAWLAQITLFLMLGLLLTPSALIPTASQALLVALALMVVARPLAVWLSLVPFGFPWREQLFISWVGLRGVVPIVLATFPVLGGVVDGSLYISIAFWVVLTSLVIQGWTVAPLAKLLDLQLPQEHAPYYSEPLDVPGYAGVRLLAYRVNEASPAVGRIVGQLPLPAGVRIAAAFRAGKPMEDVGHVEIAGGDLLYVILREDDIPILEQLLIPEDETEETEQTRYFGSFILNGDSRLGDVGEVYGIEVPGDAQDLTLAEFLGKSFRNRVVVGDRVKLGAMDLVVREQVEGRVTKVGVRIARR